MLTNELLLLLVEFTLVYLLFFAFVFVGWLMAKAFKSSSAAADSLFGATYFHFISGLLLTITLYAIVTTRGQSINILLLPLLYLLYRCPGQNSEGLRADKFRLYIFLEVALIVMLLLAVLHLFPVSEYKQADSFFYLKIAESLNLTGQENISHYFNLYNSAFHGVEPYHYFEIWITAFITRFTASFMPSINIERFVTYGLLMTGLMAGLYMLAEGVLKRKLLWTDKAFCWSLLFIFPNVLGYFPKLYYFFISDFEGNLVDRPNFRILYLLMVPVVYQLFQHKKITRQALVFLLVLSVVSFQFMLVCMPTLLLYGLYLLIKKDKGYRQTWGWTLLFIAAFFLFYTVFKNPSVPSFFQTGAGSFISNTLQKTPFVGFSITTSLLYLVLVLVLLLAPLFIFYSKELLAQLKQISLSMLPLVVLAFFGLLMARVLFLKDNAYQFLFVADIVVTFLAWWIYLLILQHRSPRFLLGASLYLVLFWCIYWISRPQQTADIFSQNTGFSYADKRYSPAYVDSVRNYFRSEKPGVGAYMGDSAFYGQTYYSLRNPNVYFLPITYLIASSKNGGLELCLSDTGAILNGIQNPVFNDYLYNAIGRNLFYSYRLKNSDRSYNWQVITFIIKQRIPYIITTKNYPVQQLNIPVSKTFKDDIIGEQFTILQYP